MTTKNIYWFELELDLDRNLLMIWDVSNSHRQAIFYLFSLSLTFNIVCSFLTYQRIFLI